MKRVKSNQAQQMVEYILLSAVVIVVILAFSGPTGPFRLAVNKVIAISLNQLVVETQLLNIEDPN